MVETLARSWGLIALRGLAGVVFGALTFVVPGLSLTVFVLLFGAYASADGALAIGAAAASRQRRSEPRWVSLLLSGLAGVVIGIATLFWPALTAVSLLSLIAGWAVVVGIGEIVAAVRLRKVISDEWLLLLAGALSAGFGLLLAVFPGEGALAVIVWIGAYAIVVGLLRIGLALRLKRWLRRLPRFR